MYELPDNATPETHKVRTTILDAGVSDGRVLVSNVIDENNRADGLALLQIDNIGTSDSSREFGLPDGSTFFVNSADRTSEYVSAAIYDSRGSARIVIWGAEGEFRNDHSIDAGQSDVANLAVSTLLLDNRPVVLGRNIVGEVAAWDLETGQQLFRQLFGPGLGPFDLGEGLVALSYSGAVEEETRVAVVEAETGNTVWDVPWTEVVQTITASASSGTLAVVSEGEVAFLDRRGSDLQPRVSVPTGFVEAAFRPRGDVLTLSTRQGEFIDIRVGSDTVASAGSWASSYELLDMAWSATGDHLLGIGGTLAGQFYRAEAVLLWSPDLPQEP